MTKRAPTGAERDALRFLERAVAGVISNAIVIGDGNATYGIGGGRTSRVDAAGDAVGKAGGRAKGAVRRLGRLLPLSRRPPPPRRRGRDGLRRAGRLGEGRRGRRGGRRARDGARLQRPAPLPALTDRHGTGIPEDIETAFRAPVPRRDAPLRDPFRRGGGSRPPGPPARDRQRLPGQARVLDDVRPELRPGRLPRREPRDGTLTIQAPASLRFDYDGPEGKVYTFDGNAARQYVAADRQIVLKTLTPAERARLPLLFLQPPSEVLDRFAAVAKAGANGLVELALTPRADADLKSVAVLATSAGEVKRLVVLDGEGNRTTFTFTNLAPRKKRPASDFALVPPKGTASSE